MNILICEDALGIVKQWIPALEAKGHKVIHFVWVHRCDSTSISGCAMDKVDHTVNLADIHLALMDGLLPGKLIGSEITPHLKEAAVPYVGTSSIGTMFGNADLDKEEVLDKLDFCLSHARQLPVAA